MNYCGCDGDYFRKDVVAAAAAAVDYYYYYCNEQTSSSCHLVRFRFRDFDTTVSTKDQNDHA